MFSLRGKAKAKGDYDKGVKCVLAKVRHTSQWLAGGRSLVGCRTRTS